MEIQYINRENNCKEVEKVYGDKLIKFIYTNSIGKLACDALKNPIFSKFYGKWQNTSFSNKKIEKFVDQYDINLDDYLPEVINEGAIPYSNFNNFFIRKFKPGKRIFSSENNNMPAFSEARYFGYPKVLESERYPVKGKFLSSEGILADERWSSEFKNGPMLIARLCPVDYHRFHFPDDGKVIDSYRISGDYHSVNPVALKNKADIFLKNERHVSILETKNFGLIAYVEVGAMCVGKIIQSYDDNYFNRGDEKGYFLFGGSTVIVLGQQGLWSPSKDIVDNTNNGLETLIKLGDSVAVKN
ncbi:MAG: phosphatidylserine decarboxylase [Bdellovibrionales bacterium]|jgi:phosphatidylserine decarboxylase|nr:phosphatidylserine decarboxylase [Bdellovibrionales bacterium]